MRQSGSAVAWGGSKMPFVRILSFWEMDSSEGSQRRRNEDSNEKINFGIENSFI